MPGAQLPDFQSDRVEYGPLVEFWQARISAIGPLGAHDEMITYGGRANVSDAHYLAHTFGDALYQIGGFEFLAYCGAGEFNYGCIHAVLGSAAFDAGSDFLPKLRTVCDGFMPQKCAHGVGHSVASIYGYDQEGLHGALASCDSLYAGDERHIRCLEGAFMEFNLREVGVKEFRTITRDWNPQDPYYPCTTLTERYMAPCMFEMPLFWGKQADVTALQSVDEQYAVIGARCRAAPAQLASWSTACMAGIGYQITAEHGYAPATIRRFCDAATNSEVERALCLAEASMRYKVNGIGRTGATGTCQNLSLNDMETRFCEDYVRSSREDQLRPL